MEGEATHGNEPVLAPKIPLLEGSSVIAPAEGTTVTSSNENSQRTTRCWTNLTQHWRGLLIVVAPLVLLPLPLLGDSKEARCGYVILLMATFWMTEALPIAITALIPVFAFPMMGILGTDAVCFLYMKENVMMSFGGLTVASAVEHCNLHRRVAFFVLLHVGQSPRWLLAGFMITTMFLSMWLSNTATTTMMTPIIGAVLLELYKGHDAKKATDMETTSITHQAENDFSAKSQVLIPLQKSKNDSIDSNQDTQQDVDAISVATVDEPPNDDWRRLRDMCFIGTAYAANIGGTGTLMGTGPNIVFKGILLSYTEPTGLNYSTWMGFNVPGMLLCVTMAWLWLQFLYMGFGKKKIEETSAEKGRAIKNLLRRQYEDLGSMSFHEFAVFTLFITLILLWLFRSPTFVPGWGKLLESVHGHSVEVDDASSVMLIVFLLFVIPSKPNFLCFRSDPNGPKSSSGCLTWQVVHEKIPWRLLLLFGGGFAIAKGADKSGLSMWLGQQLIHLDALPKEVIVLVVCIMVVMVTQVASNTATSAVVLPVLKELAVGIGVSPLYLMLPATVCCSYAFMLPISTAPNAIVYAASNMRNTEMMRAGAVMSIICVLVTTIMINTLGVAMFDVKNLPSWANSTALAST